MSELSRIRAKKKVDLNLPMYASLVHMLRAAVENEPDVTAVIYEDRRISYREFGRAVSGFARHLESAGIRHGDRVVLMMPNTIEMDIALMGVMSVGAQVAPVNPSVSSCQNSRCQPVIGTKSSSHSILKCWLNICASSPTVIP
jgi:acyl-CoA synthetase (AMP-forming)/AMP-acid ligase II